MDCPIAGSGNTTIRALPSPGHTPGHIGVDIRSGEKRLWLLVDTLHAPFQSKYTDWSPRFDVNPELARATRADLLKAAAEQKIPVHLYHFPFPGIGSVKKTIPGFSFNPVTL